jgi:hypothetical protein
MAYNWLAKEMLGVPSMASNSVPERIRWGSLLICLTDKAPFASPRTTIRRKQVRIREIVFL